MTSATIKPPGPLLVALEARAPWEFGLGLAAYPLLAQTPKGDGHPVLVLPGLAAGDLSTLPLRQFLKERGYDAHGWDLGLNFGPRPGILESARHRLQQLYRASGRTVSLLGWSLGGVYARELAKLEPDKSRQVITLGTPFTGEPKATNAWRVFEFTSGTTLGDAAMHRQIAEPPPVPTTSIFSRTDGVVAWQNSLETVTAIAENIEIQASHVGMGVNPAALYAIADRLAQPEGRWRPFTREGWRSWVFPDPERTTQSTFWPFF